jgi:hypothetical protein
MDPQVVQHDLARWRHDFESGHIKPGWRGPRLEPEERLAANLGTVVVDDEYRRIFDLGLLVQLEPDGLAGPVSGTAFATNERLVVQGHHDHDHEWRFTDIYSVHVMPRGAAVVVQQYSEDDRVTLVGPPSGGRIVHGRAVIPRTDPQNRLSLWLRVEAAFVAASGTEALDAWFAELPNRLATL